MIGYMMSADTDEYNDRERLLTMEVSTLRGLRDAQQPGSQHYMIFQGRIDGLTRVLLRLQENVSDLRKLDKMIAQEIRATDRAEISYRQVGIGRMAAAGLVALIGLAILVMSVASWGFVTAVIGFVLLAGGGIALSLMARARRLATDDKDDALDRLAVLQDRRRRLNERIDGENETRAPLAIQAPEGVSSVFADAARRGAKAEILAENE